MAAKKSKTAKKTAATGVDTDIARKIWLAGVGAYGRAFTEAQDAAGKLAAGYPGIGQGYDMMVISALGLNAEEVKKFLAETKPTYPQFEAWIKRQPGVNLTRSNIHALNLSIAGYQHKDEVIVVLQGLHSAAYNRARSMIPAHRVNGNSHRHAYSPSDLAARST